MDIENACPTSSRLATIPSSMDANDSRYDDKAPDRYDTDGPPGDADDTSSFFPYAGPMWGSFGFGGFPWYRADVDEEPINETPAEDDESLWDEGLFSLLIVAGAILFVFPEPATSLIGVILLLIGGLGWLFDALT